MKNFFIQARKYGLLQHLKYLSNLSRVSVYLQADLDHLPPLKDVSPYYIRQMDFENENDISLWVDCVNDAYSEFGEHKLKDQDASSYLSHHLFMNVWGVFFIMNEKQVIGAITYGTYKENSKIGCVSRIAVKSDYKGKGLGKFIINYAFHHLRSKGIEYGQSIIGLKRKTSILTHMKCGFFPQYNRKYFVYDNQTRFFFIRWITFRRLKHLQKSFLVNTFANFIS
jgi:GNAT superfamily N-acetyltransferase